jgi:hemoglobin
MNPTESTIEPSLYEQLGGASAVEAAVDIFYRKVLSDDRVSSFFEDVDMDRQISKQKGFLTMAFGGPHAYSSFEMRRAHAPLLQKGLNDAHFNVIAELLAESLNDLNVDPALISRVIAIAESTRADVLGR